MRTLDEVIEGLGSPYYNNFKKYKADAVAYLKMYRSDKLQWEREKDDMQSRYQEAIDNCEQAENRFKAALKRLDIGTLNEPLTWEELKELEGKPVWVVVDGKERWRIIGEVTNEHLILESGLPLHKSWMNHPDGWQAYRKERS